MICVKVFMHFSCLELKNRQELALKTSTQRVNSKYHMIILFGAENQCVKCTYILIVTCDHVPIWHLIAYAIARFIRVIRPVWVISIGINRNIWPYNCLCWLLLGWRWGNHGRRQCRSDRCCCCWHAHWCCRSRGACFPTAENNIILVRMSAAKENDY